MGKGFWSFWDRPRAPHVASKSMPDQAGEVFDRVKARAKLKRQEGQLSSNGKKTVARTRFTIKRIF